MAIKSYSLVESHASAVNLLKNGKQRYVKVINNNQQLSWPLPTTRYKGFIFWKVTNDEIPVCWSWQCRDWIGCLVLSLSTMIWLSVLQERAFAGLLLLPVLFGHQFFKRGSLLVCCYYLFYCRCAVLMFHGVPD